MRIAVISTTCLRVPPETYGGTELMIYELAEGLVERGHDVVLYATGDSVTSAELRALYPRAEWPPNLMADLNHVAWAMADVQRDRFDVVHAHTAAALAFGRLIPATPLIYTLHHVKDELLSRFYQFFGDAWYVAISENQARNEAPLPRLEVIHHGLDPSVFEWTSTPEDYVCFIGRFAEIKGPHTAIDVAGRARVPIHVAGEVHPVDRVFGDREIEHRLVMPHVRYLGCVGIDRKVPLLRGARALLAPITWDEPFGLTLIEAMLSGCPVVAFPRGSVPELVEEGVTGFIANSAEEMVELIRPGGPLDGFDRRRCRERAVERFSRARMVDDHIRLYERVVTAQESGSPAVAASSDPVL